MAGQHAGAEHQHRVVERSAFALLDAVEPPGDVGHLLEKKTVHFQPVGGVAVREQVVNHVVHAEVREAQRAVVVVQLERADARGVGLERQHEEVAHDAHVLDDVLRVAVFRARHVGLGQGRPPALQLAALAGARDSHFHLANGVEVFVEFLPVEPADVAAQILRVRQHGIEHALVAGLCLVLEHLVERKCGVDLERRRRSRAAPRDVRAVQHRVILVHGGVRLFTAKHETRQLGSMANVLRDELIDTGAGLDPPARGQRRAGEQVAGLRTVDVALERLGVVETSDEHHPIPEIVERMQHLAQLHVGAFAFGPPFVPVKTAPGEQDRHAGWRLARLPGLSAGVAPNAQRFHPRQRHRYAEAAQHRAPGKLVMSCFHFNLPFG